MLGFIERPLPLPNSILESVLGVQKVGAGMPAGANAAAAIQGLTGASGTDHHDASVLSSSPPPSLALVGPPPLRSRRAPDPAAARLELPRDRLGTFDRAQLQRGFKVYREVCASCHGLSYVAFRNLDQPGGPEFSEAQVQALAAEYKVKDGPNDAGDMFERPGPRRRSFPGPVREREGRRAANGGKAPPDLSLMAKARTYERGFPWFVFDMFTQFAETGPDYMHARPRPATRSRPQGVTVPAGGHYNQYFPGHIIAMPKPLSDGAGRVSRRGRRTASRRCPRPSISTPRT